MKYRLITGEVSIGDWADIVFTVTKLQLPWRTLAPKLALMNGDGTRVKYNANLVSVQLGGTRVCLISSFSRVQKSLYRIKMWLKSYIDTRILSNLSSDLWIKIIRDKSQWQNSSMQLK